MLSTPDGPFINLARLNMAKYAARPNLAKALFEYIFHHENDVRNVSKLSNYKCMMCALCCLTYVQGPIFSFKLKNSKVFHYFSFQTIDELFMIPDHVVMISNLDNALYCLSKYVSITISLK